MGGRRQLGQHHLDVGSDPLRRIPMMEPLKGSRMFVERLFEECATPAELVERLAS